MMSQNFFYLKAPNKHQHVQAHILSIFEDIGKIFQKTKHGTKQGDLVSSQ